MKYFFSLFVSTILLFFWGLAEGKLKVAATVPDLAAIAQAVGGDRIESFSLTLPTQDPHFADARPNLALQLNRANLLLVIGLELESGWLPVLLTGSRNPSLQKGSDGYLDVSSVAQLKEIPTTKVDRSMGDIHPGGNPHFLIDPGNAIRVGRAIAQRLSKLDPDGAPLYQTRVGQFVKNIQIAQRRWSQELQPYQGTPIVAYHKSWIYFADAMGLKIVDYLEPKPGIPPTAAHVLRVIQTIRLHQIPLILQEEYYPDKTAKLVAEKTGAKLVIMRGGTDLRRGESYVDRLDSMVRRLLAALPAKKRGSEI